MKNENEEFLDLATYTAKAVLLMAVLIKLVWELSQI